MTVGEAAVGIAEHHPIRQGIQIGARSKLRHAVARASTQDSERCRRHAGLESKCRVRRRGEVDMVCPHLIDQRTTLRPCHKVIWIADWRRDDTVQISWQKTFLVGAANDSACLRSSARIAHEHFRPIKYKRL